YRRLGLVPSLVGFQLNRPTLFVLSLSAIGRTVVLSSRPSVPLFSLRSGRKFLGCSASLRWSSERFAFCSIEQSARSSALQKIFWPASIGWGAGASPLPP